MSLRQDLARLIKENKPSSPWSENFDLDFSFDLNFPVFLGHFPDHPVVPAMLQIIMAEMTLDAWQERSCKTVEILQSKFLHPIEPPCTVNCSVSIQDKLARAEFKINNELYAHLKWKFVYSDE